MFELVAQQITWGIEHHAEGGWADAYLYCIETKCPECGWMVPLAPSWVIGNKTKTIAKLVPNTIEKNFRIDIEMVMAKEEMLAAKANRTVRDSSLQCPNSYDPTR